MNIGTRPTVNGDYRTIEVHFLDFSKDLYDTTLTVELLYFIRDEVKFDSIDALINQIKKDEVAARNYIKALL